MLWLFSSKKRIHTNYKANLFLNWSLWERSHSLQWSAYPETVSWCNQWVHLQSNPCLVSFLHQSLACQSALSLPSCGSSPLSAAFETMSHGCSDCVCGRETLTLPGREGQKPWQDRESCFIPAAPAVCCSLGIQQEHWQGHKEALGRWGRNPGCSNNSPDRDIRDVSIPKFSVLPWHDKNKYCSDLNSYEHFKSSVCACAHTVKPDDLFLIFEDLVFLETLSPLTSPFK